MILHVNVTADHIRRGTRGDCSSCPIALAIHDAGYPQAVVRARSVAPTKLADHPSHPRRVPLLNAAKEFIVQFDEGGPFAVKPFEFDIPNWPDA